MKHLIQKLTSEDDLVDAEMTLQLLLPLPGDKSSEAHSNCCF